MKKILILSWLVLSFYTLTSQNDINRISQEEKIYGLSKFWKEAKYNFAYFDRIDIDWDKKYKEYITKVLETENDADYYTVLRQFGALLKDGHTGIYLTPEYITDYTKEHLPKKWFNFYCSDDGVFVTSVRENIAEYLPLNSKIIEIDNIPILDYLEEKCYPYISSAYSHTLKSRCYNCLLFTIEKQESIKFETPDGKIAEYVFPLDNPSKFDEIKSFDIFEKMTSRPQEHSYTWLENEILYVDLAGEMGMHTVNFFQEHYTLMEKSAGIIMDLRNNIGGTSIGYLIINLFTEKDSIELISYTRVNRANKRALGAYADSTQTNYKYFTNQKFELDRFVSKNGISIEYRLIDKPIVMLIDSHVVSASENFLMLFKMLNLATFVGRPTFGSCSQPLLFSLPGGGYAWLSTQKTMITLEEEFTYIEPDYYVRITLQNLINGDDPIFEKGLEIMKEKLY